MQIEDGQRLIDRLVGEGIAVTAACWAKESESGQWFLYIATPLVGEDGAKRPAYRRVNTVIREMQKEGFWIDPLDVKLIGHHDPIARDIVEHRGRRLARTPTRFQGSRLGELAVEEAYIYPPTTDGRWIFVFEYRRRGETKQWDAVDSGHCDRWAPNESWTDGDVRVEPQGRTVVIRVYSEEAVQEDDAMVAEVLAREEFQKRFPGHTIV